MTASLSFGALGHALVFAALVAADRAVYGSVIASVRLCFDELRKRDDRIADPADADIAALLNGEFRPVNALQQLDAQMVRCPSTVPIVITPVRNGWRIEAFGLRPFILADLEWTTFREAVASHRIRNAEKVRFLWQEVVSRARRARS